MSRMYTYKEPKGNSTYVSTHKDAPLQGGKEELVYWVLANKIDDKFGGAPVTVSEIYHQVTGPMGLSVYDTLEVVKRARKLGYLKVEK
jgi:hypothetical protein